jgi:long-chain acyl-CoA synthetase
MNVMKELLTAHEVLAGWSEEVPDREFLLQPVDGRIHVITFREALDQARRMAAALSRLGMVPDDRIAILAKNSAV